MLRGIACAVLIAAVLVLVGVAWVRASVAREHGHRSLASLSVPAGIERDARGIVTISAHDERDATRVLGYVHAQERYFEMDLMRRDAAGELAALFGARALPRDRARRLHRMRSRAQAALTTMDAPSRALLDAYVDGVNAGLQDLSARPWAYLLLRQTPRAWTAADTLLVGHAMYFDLQDSTNARERALMRIRPRMPPALFDLLVHDGSRWDAPLMGVARGDAVLPDAKALDLRRLPSPPTDAGDTEERAPGSNNFAVGARATRDGRAIVADDMHLGLRAPNIWFRAQLRYRDARAPNGFVDIGGVTLPGLPAMVVGSNRYVAWGFTNAYADTADWKRERACTTAARSTATPACVAITTHRERIDIAGGAHEMLVVRETEWGPVLHDNADGSIDTLRWVAHLPGALNLQLARLATAGSITDALRIADAIAMPAQNILFADRTGRIAWRVTGALPARSAGCAPAMQPGAVAAAACTPWPATTQGHPVILDPPNARLWTANNRVADGAALARLGDAGYAQGMRALQIRDGLVQRRVLNERDLLAIQLDDRAWTVDAWWGVMHDASRRAGTPALRALAQASPRRPLRADVESTSFRIARAWRQAVNERIAAGLLAPAHAVLDDDDAPPSIPQLESIAWPLVTTRPAHLVPRVFARCVDASAACGDASWNALMEDAAREVRDSLLDIGPLAQRTWGESNTAAICHPLSAALPLIGPRALCMPADPLPGDVGMPRVQRPGFGASQRMVVSPGREADGILHMPGGQSGHPMSRYWGAGHDDWVRGRPSAFLPGRTERVLVLMPE